MYRRFMVLLLFVIALLFPVAPASASAAALPGAGLVQEFASSTEQQPLQWPAPRPAADGQVVFLPMVSTQVAAVRIGSIEVTQATQTANNSVPLIASRPTVARLHLQGAHSVGPLRITLAGSREGVPLPGSPLVRTVNPGPFVNLLLPATWLDGTIKLEANVELVNGHENSEATIAGQEVEVSYIAAPPLDLTIVPLEYTHLPSGVTYAPPATFGFLDTVQRMFPIPHINVNVRAPYSARGNLGDSAWWSTFVTTELVNLANADGAPLNTIYIAVLPIEIMDDMRPALAGIGFSNRMVLTFDYNLVATHELGHALGRKHSDCGSPESGSLDLDYPYQGGIIGAPGYDVTHDIMYEPSSTRDIMSYCEEWVSDYTYRGMLEDQMARGVPTEAVVADALLVSGDLSRPDFATLGPVYAFRTRLSETDDTALYQIAFYDSGENLIAIHGVPVHSTAEKGETLAQFGVALPRPDQPVARVALLRGGEEIDSRTITIARHIRTRVSAMVVGGALRITNQPLSDPDILSPPLQGAEPAISAPPAASDRPYMLRYHSGNVEAADEDDHWTTLTVNAVDGTQNYVLENLPAAPDGSATIQYIPSDTLLVTPKGLSQGASITTTVNIVVPGAAAAATDTIVHAFNHAPTVWFGAVRPIGAGESVLLTGYASDLEDGALSSHLQWHVNGAPVASGPYFQIQSLDQPMFVELTATDAQGARTTATLQIAPH